MHKLLIICGPTATGKTALALSLAKKFNGEIVSADSKQVYRGLDIGTGKDVPPGVKIWGYDLVGPKEEFSVSEYVTLAQSRIEEILKAGKLPLLVGGTGLYIKAIVDGIPTVRVPKNNNLRRNLAEKPAEELFELLAQVDPIKAGSLNASDKKNPRRLVRALEIATWKLEGKKLRPKGVSYKTLFIGLTAPRAVLFRRIGERVQGRLAAGMEAEIKNLLGGGVTWDDQAMSSLGYRQWRGFFEKKKSKTEVINDWRQEERKYAKRQITWFKTDARINWFDITKPQWQKKVELMVKRWYSS